LEEFPVDSPWYIARHNQKYGPYSAEELQQLADSGKLAGDDLLWREGLSDWQPARVVLGQFARTAPPPPLPTSAPKRVSQRDPLEEEEEYPSVQLTERPPGQFPGRLISPGFFLLSLLLFLLPWVDVRCDHVFVVASQSGLQACIGDYSESTLAINERLQKGNELLPFNPQEERLKPAVLLIIYALLLLAGLIAGLAIPVGKIRLAALASCAGLAFSLLVAQVAVGFPIKEPVARANVRQQQNPMPPGIIMPPGPFGPAPVAGHRLTTEYTAVFWLAFLFTLGPVGGLLIEHLAVFKPRRRRERFGYS
jgi:hypothetical protein